ncbi:MAG: hypothetical protein J6O40_03850 [Ruminococcus sp.]|nr:hypothetical protein [Ruminococcus sp.]
MKKLITVFAALIIGIIAAMPVYALDFDSFRADVSWADAPEGTAYLDILIRLPKDDPGYTEFNAPPRRISRGYLDKDENAVYEYESLNIGESSEIARYSEDGYVSLACHYRGLRLMTINGNDKDGYFKQVKQELSLYRDSRFDLSPDITELREKYGDFKAAYVDENGKVLGVTSECEVIYDAHEPYALVAEGDKLTFRIFGYGDPKTIGKMIMAAIIAVGALIIVSVIVLCFVLRLFGRGFKKYADFVNKPFEDDDR